MRVLMVVHDMNRGGVESFIMNVFRTINRDIIQFDFIYHSYEKSAFDEEIIALGGKIYHCPNYAGTNHFQYIKWWNEFFKQHQEYRIIHSNLNSCANIHLRIAKKYGLIAVAHAHNTQNGVGIRAFAKTLLKIDFNNCCDYRFACSGLAADFLYGKRASEAEIIKNGIITEKFIYNSDISKEYRNSYSIQDDELVIGSVGRININKNHTFVVDILNELNRKGISATYILVGDGPEKDNIAQKAKNLGIEDKLILLGIRSDVNTLMQMFDVFVMPSFFEGLPVSSIEAQASGLKCFLSDRISSESDATGLVEFLSLDSGAEFWAERIIESVPYERKDTSNLIINAGFDIEYTSNWLTDFYLGAVKDKTDE